MRQLSMSVRRHRAAGMDVRIDQGAESFGALKPRIKIEAQLACQRQIRALSGGRDDAVNRADPPQSFGCLALNDNRAPVLPQR